MKKTIEEKKLFKIRERKENKTKWERRKKWAYKITKWLKEDFPLSFTFGLSFFVLPKIKRINLINQMPPCKIFVFLMKF